MHSREVQKQAQQKSLLWDQGGPQEQLPGPLKQYNDNALLECEGN